MEHELALALASGGASLAGAELSPPDTDISDIVEAAQRGCGGLEFVVREVHARLAIRMRRAALIQGALPLLLEQLCVLGLFVRQPMCSSSSFLPVQCGRGVLSRR